MGLRTLPCIDCHLFFTYSVFILLFWWMFITNNGLIKHWLNSVVLWVCVCLISISVCWKRGRDLKGEAVTHYPGRKLHPPWPPSLHVQRWVATLPTRFGHICMIGSNQFIHSFFVLLWHGSQRFLGLSFTVPSTFGTKHKLWQHSSKNALIIQQRNWISGSAQRYNWTHSGLGTQPEYRPKMVTSILLR